jgi:hypothetical protein
LTIEAQSEPCCPLTRCGKFVSRFRSRLEEANIGEHLESSALRITAKKRLSLITSLALAKSSLEAILVPAYDLQSTTIIQIAITLEIQG